MNVNFRLAVSPSCIVFGSNRAQGGAEIIEEIRSTLAEYRYGKNLRELRRNLGVASIRSEVNGQGVCLQNFFKSQNRKHGNCIELAEEAQREIRRKLNLPSNIVCCKETDYFWRPGDEHFGLIIPSPDGEIFVDPSLKFVAPKLDATDRRNKKYYWGIEPYTSNKSGSQDLSLYYKREMPKRGRVTDATPLGFLKDLDPKTNDFGMVSMYLLLPYNKTKPKVEFLLAKPRKLLSDKLWEPPKKSNLYEFQEHLNQLFRSA